MPGSLDRPAGRASTPTIVLWLVVAVTGVAAIVWGAETFAEHLAVASTRLGVSVFALAGLPAGALPPGSRETAVSAAAKR